MHLIGIFKFFRYKNFTFENKKNSCNYASL